jgi:hypothetical protein
MEFALEILSESGFPLVLLRKARFPRFLRQDTYGFQISYQVRTAEVLEFKKMLRERYEAVVHIETLHRNKDGLETVFIRGRWARKGGLKRRDQAAKTLRSLSDCQRYLSRSPEVVGEKLRVSIRGEQSKIRRTLARFDERKVPYSVAKLVELEG